MMNAFERYTEKLLPRLDPDALETETISLCAGYREDLADAWGDLSQGEQEKVRQADRVLIERAADVAEYWREDQSADIREVYEMPLENWWWWLDKIADGSFPAELLPKFE